MTFIPFGIHIFPGAQVGEASHTLSGMLSVLSELGQNYMEPKRFRYHGNRRYLDCDVYIRLVAEGARFHSFGWGRKTIRNSKTLRYRETIDVIENPSANETYKHNKTA